jgi:hypothetical protein
LDEATGVRRDLLTTNPLTSSNGTGQTQGPLGPAANFVSASNQSLIHNDAAQLRISPNGWTADCWVRIVAANGTYTILGKFSSGIDGEYLLGTSGSTWNWTLSNEVSTTTLTGPATVAGVWTYLAGWYDPVPGRMYLQVNGAPPLSVAAGLVPVGGILQFRIGRQANGANVLNGAVQHAGLWARVLTPAERAWRARGGVLL